MGDGRSNRALTRLPGQLSALRSTITALRTHAPISSLLAACYGGVTIWADLGRGPARHRGAPPHRLGAHAMCANRVWPERFDILVCMRGRPATRAHCCRWQWHRPAHWSRPAAKTRLYTSGSSATTVGRQTATAALRTCGAAGMAWDFLCGGYLEKSDGLSGKPRRRRGFGLVPGVGGADAHCGNAWRGRGRVGQSCTTCNQ